MTCVKLWVLLSLSQLVTLKDALLSLLMVWVVLPDFNFTEEN